MPKKPVYFSPALFTFLRQLAKNNNREWFQKNKKWYDECREKMYFLTDVLINEIRKFDSSIPSVSPADCMFRIFRDVRFSNDKRPYKTNFGSFIARGGRKASLQAIIFILNRMDVLPVVEYTCPKPIS